VGISYTDPRKRRFWNAVLDYIFLRKNIRNGVPEHSITKILQNKGTCLSPFGNVGEGCWTTMTTAYV
jgi:hypothetical protein